MALGRFTYCALFIALLAAKPGLNAADSNIVRLWQLNLEKALSARTVNVGSGFPVFAIEFSPDGKQIAVVAAQIRIGVNQIRNRLFVIQAKDPNGSIKQFDVPLGTVKPTWSPSGELIDASGSVIRVADGAVCSIPELGYFIAENEIITWPTGPAIGLPTHFTVFDNRCRPVRTIEPGEEWSINGVSLDRHLMSVEGPPGRVAGSRETLIADSRDGHVLARWQIAVSPFGRFADNGRALCSPFGVEGSPTSSVRCWNVDTGSVISDSPGDYGSTPIVSAARSSRLVFSDFRYIRGLTRDWDRHSFKSAVVWDFRSNQKVASWVPEYQTYDLAFYNGTSAHTKDPFVFAISPDGQYLAEGGSGVLRLSKIEH